MTEKKVVLSKDVRRDIQYIADYIISISRPEHAEQYAKILLEDIASLSYLATSRPDTPWQIPKRFHPKAKVLTSRNRKWSIIFHVEGEYAVVDRVIPSVMITY